MTVEVCFAGAPPRSLGPGIDRAGPALLDARKGAQALTVRPGAPIMQAVRQCACSHAARTVVIGAVGTNRKSSRKKVKAWRRQASQTGSSSSYLLISSALGMGDEDDLYHFSALLLSA